MKRELFDISGHICVGKPLFSGRTVIGPTY